MLSLFFLVIVGLVAVLIAYLALQGIGALAAISFVILKPIFLLLGRSLGSNGADVVARLDEKFFGISREQEIVSGPLTEEFKATAKGKLAPDIWHDGRRLYFEVGNRSYSVKTDLEGARKRKNELLTEQ